MATDPPADLALAPLDGEPRTLEEWLVTFHLAVVVLDPYTYESAWVLDTAGRILRHFTGADCRVAFVITASPAEARQFLGPWAKQLLSFADPDRAFVKGLGLERLPAFVHVNQNGTVAAAAEGWDPPAWRTVSDSIARMAAWSRPVIPAQGDPQPYEGTPALA